MEVGILSYKLESAAADDMQYDRLGHNNFTTRERHARYLKKNATDTKRVRRCSLLKMWQNVAPSPFKEAKIVLISCNLLWSQCIAEKVRVIAQLPAAMQSLSCHYHYTKFLPEGKMHPADKLQLEAATILPLDGPARSNQGPIKYGHGAQYLYCSPPAGASLNHPGINGPGLTHTQPDN